MPIDVQEVRLKVANRQPISVVETLALFQAEGLFIGRRVIRTARGFIIIMDDEPAPPQRQHQHEHQLGPRIEITEHAIRAIGARDNREIAQHMAHMARLRWGEGASVAVRGNRQLRAACREAGLTVINANPMALAWQRAWRMITLRPARLGPPRAAAAPQPQLA